MSLLLDKVAVPTHATPSPGPNRERSGVAPSDASIASKVSTTGGVEEGRAGVKPSTTPALIAGHEVLPDTAAAAIPTTGRWIAVLRRIFTVRTAHPRAAHGYHLARYSYLERGCMAREMDRL